ncbi:hypothetical protein K8B33_15380 [Alcanivorax sp. JB21]|uniref:hypothetical protein n=1 Tax=Alcanivorax limicola TaxID=2874102 RepID=UPI001CBC609F|nr:hypothetical protein [Alcanivorax limicola]MBZ2190491.1 hypothetical protein [Alcanivorax limicola]
MAFDPRDPYDAAALYDMWLNCQACPATFDFEPERPLGLDYYHDIGQRAKTEGWVVREQPPEEGDQDVSYLVCCPQCANRLGLSPTHTHHQRHGRAPGTIMDICAAVRAAESEIAA